MSCVALIPSSYAPSHSLSMPHRIIQPRIVGWVKPYQLFASLMHETKMRTSALARAMGKPKLQPSLHRYLRGEVPMPERTTAAPLAQYFGLPVDAVYEEGVATTIAKQRGLQLVDWPPKTARAEKPAVTDDRVKALVREINAMPAADRARALEALGVPALQLKPSSPLADNVMPLPPSSATPGGLVKSRAQKDRSKLREKQDAAVSSRPHKPRPR